MTNLKRYDLGSAADINWYESSTGNVCDAPEVVAIIETIQAEVAAKDERIERLLVDLERADKRIVELLQLNQAIVRQGVNVAEQRASLTKFADGDDAKLRMREVA